MIDHLPIFPIIIPLIAAPLCALFRHSLIPWSILIITTWSSFASSLVLLYNISSHSTIIYRMGWVAPIESIPVDLLNAFIMVLVSGMATIVAVYARQSVEQEIDRGRQHIYYSAFLLAFGLLGICHWRCLQRLCISWNFFVSILRHRECRP